MKGNILVRAVVAVLLPLVCLAVALAARQQQPPRQQQQRRPARAAAAPRNAAARPATFERAVLPFMSENCYACHNAKLQSGGLNLESLKTAASLTKDRATWEHVLQKLGTGEMPPVGMPRPDEAKTKAVMTWLEKEFERADNAAPPDPGRVTARRLNRAEYNNTVRDLLGVDFRPADDFPQDDSGYGFDNIGDVLSLSPVLMEKYLAAAEKIARTALFGPEALKPTLTRHRSPGRKIVTRTTPLFDYDLTGLSLPNAFHVTHRFPVEGEYLVRVFLGGVRPAGSEPIKIGLWVDGRQVQMLTLDPEGIATFADDRQDFGGMTREFRARIPAGDHWIAASILNIYDGLPPSYNGPNPSTRPIPPPPVFKPRAGLPAKRVEELRKIFEAERAEIVPTNDARISSLEVGGPYNQVMGPSPESLKKIYLCGHLRAGEHGAKCAEPIAAGLARRAYRRPVAAEEVERLVRLISAAQKDGDSFEGGVSLALQAMLVSPHFLFRIERDQLPAGGGSSSGAGGGHLISEHELASRLSYFLWSSMPDEALLACADQGVLRRPAVFAAQVRRMLKDPKSQALVENFGGQWLELRKLESVTPDRERFPDFEEYLRMSMRRETELFFESIIREDRSILDFIDSDYTFLNERLARFYEIPGVVGPEFRRVALRTDVPRGGILTQASVLTVSSYATRTSPVLRGKWILENLLNDPPPPPPPDVPNLNEAKVGESVSLRQELEEHRKNTTCASCHSRMDPLGFGLENYNAIGAWRVRDGKFPIDAAGQLPDGRSFNGPDELRAVLKADRAAFARGLTEKLLTFATGRGLESYDKRTVKEIAGRVAANDYRFSSLVLEIASSQPFQMRRGDQTK